MQLQSVLAVFSLALVAAAAPAPGGGGEGPPPPTCSDSQILSCCINEEPLIGADCTIAILGIDCGILNGALTQQACCETDQNGLINVALPCTLL